MGSKPAPKRRTWLFVILSGVALCLVVCLVALVRVGTSAGVIPTRTPFQTWTPAPTSIPPTATQQPTEPADPLEALRLKLESTLGESNRHVRRFDLALDGTTLQVTIAANDNLTDGLIKSGIQSDVYDTLKAASASRVQYDRLLITVTFQTADAFGQTAETELVRATYTRETLGKIVWGNFNKNNIYTIADDLYLHPLAVP